MSGVFVPYAADRDPGMDLGPTVSWFHVHESARATRARSVEVTMKIQVNTGENVQGTEDLIRFVRERIENAVANFGDTITRVEAHISDENAAKGGKDKRCLLEARLKGLKPIAVTHQAESLQFAVDGATEKLKAAISSTLGRLGAR